MNDNSLIPAALMERLELLRPVLELQGVVQQRPSGYRLRFRIESDGYVQHRSIELVDIGTATAVLSLIAKWRCDRAARQQEILDARDAERCAKERRRAQLNLLYALETPRPSWRRRKKLDAWWDSLQTDAHAALRFMLTKELPIRGKRGHPFTSFW